MFVALTFYRAYVLQIREGSAYMLDPRLDLSGEDFEAHITHGRLDPSGLNPRTCPGGLALPDQQTVEHESLNSDAQEILEPCDTGKLVSSSGRFPRVDLRGPSLTDGVQRFPAAL